MLGSKARVRFLCPEWIEMRGCSVIRGRVIDSSMILTLSCGLRHLWMANNHAGGPRTVLLLRGLVD